MIALHRIPKVTKVDVPRPFVLRLKFDDGLVRELEFVQTGQEGMMFEALLDAEFFALVSVDPVSGTIVWPNAVDLDPSVLHGDYEAAGTASFREVRGGPAAR